MTNELSPSAATSVQTVRVEGMSCAACAARLQRALAGLDGVLEAQVNFATHTAHITVQSPTGIAAPVLAAAIEGAGYEAARQRWDLQVAEMSCAACTTRVQRTIERSASVLAASVNFATARAQLWMLDGADIAPVLAALTRAGYPATVSQSAADANAQRRAAHAATGRAMLRQCVLAMLLAAPLWIFEMGPHAADALRWIERQFVVSSTTQAAATSAQNAVLAPRGLEANSHEMAANVRKNAASSANLGDLAHSGHNPWGLAWAWQWALALAVLLGPARGVMLRGVRALLRGAPDMNALVALGAGAAFGYSSVATFAPQWLPEGARHVYFESVATIAAFVLLGRWLEHRARAQASDAIERLAALAPQNAQVRRIDAHGHERWVTLPIAQLVPGDVWVARPGQALAADGVVIEGCAAVNEAMLTGEAAPVDKSPNSSVTGGTLNTGPAALIVRTTRVGAGSTLAQIIELVERAQADRVPLAALAERVTRHFVPAVLALAALTWCVWALALGDAQAALVAAVSVLIVACPCAMGLAVPMAVLVGTGRAAARGVLFRRAQALQALAAAHTVAFDKTGTLTEGQPVLKALQVWPSDAQNRFVFNDFQGDAIDDGDAARVIVAAVASAQSRSAHPLARAWAQAAAQRNLALPTVCDFRAHTAQGISAHVAWEGEPTSAQNGHLAARGLGEEDAQKSFKSAIWHVGTLAFLEKAGVVLDVPARRWCEAAAQAGYTPMGVACASLGEGESADLAIDNKEDFAQSQRPKLVALAAAADALRPEAAAALAALHDARLQLALISGDRREAVAQVAAKLGIDTAHAGASPAEKLQLIETMQANEKSVVFVGDGINDAPALARANVGIALGGGADIAAQAADVVLMRADLALVPWALRLARATLANMRQNLFWAFAYNVALIPLAAGVFTPWGYTLSPHWAAAAMAASSVLVTLNALRLRWV